MIARLLEALDAANGWLFEHGMMPGLYAVGAMEWAEDAQEWLNFALLGLLQLAVAYVVFRPLEALAPVERWPDRRLVRTDVVYALVARLGVLPLLAFVLLSGLQEPWQAFLTQAGLLPPTLEQLLPWLGARPVLAFLAYVLVLDFCEYWRHRAQHGLRWWWALHAIHHAQRQMSFWTDDRNHVLDDVLAALWFGLVALLIGVPPGQFPLIVLLLRLVESLSHANLRLHFGWLGERLLVSPRFHRLHHGELSAGEGGRNYAVLLPVWDWLFGTADWQRDRFPPTGDPEAGPDLERGGWWRQQWAGLQRLGRVLRGG